MNGRVAIVAGPHQDLREGWDDVAHRWADAVGLAASVSSVPNAPALRNTLDEALRTTDAILVAPGELALEPGLVEQLVDGRQPTVRVAFDLDAPAGPAVLRRIQGRGFAGLHWALRHLAAELALPPRTVPYGDHPDQVADLRLPTGPDTAPVAVLIHGGFWRHEWERDTLDQLAVRLTERGWATWNVGYRRVGPSGGGWPTTWDDAAAAVDALRDLERREAGVIDLDRCVLVGHSVGGALACWLAADSATVRPSAVVSVAGLLDLRHAAQVELGDGAVTAALGEPAEHHDRYEAVSPVELVPLGLPTHLLHGEEDEVVPALMSRTYQTTATATGDDVAVRTVPDAGHFDPLMPERPAGTALLELLDDLPGAR